MRSNDLIFQPVERKTESRSDRLAQVVLKRGEEEMADKGQKDKDKREQQKKAKLTLKEKRKRKQEKKMSGAHIGED